MTYDLGERLDHARILVDRLRGIRTEMMMFVYNCNQLYAKVGDILQVDLVFPLQTE